VRIGLVSDTHAARSVHELPERLFERLKGTDHILHAGDIASLPVLDALSRIAPVTAVAGNMDPPELRDRLGSRQLLELGGRTIGLQHGHQPHALQDHYIASDYEDDRFELFFGVMKEQLPGAEIIVFGHFHRPLIKTWRGVLFINPGAIVRPHRQPTLAILELPALPAPPTAQIISL